MPTALWALLSLIACMVLSVIITYFTVIVEDATDYEIMMRNEDMLSDDAADGARGPPTDLNPLSCFGGPHDNPYYVHDEQIIGASSVSSQKSMSSYAGQHTVVKETVIGTHLI